MREYPTDATGTVVYVFTPPPRVEPEDMATPPKPSLTLSEYLQFLLGRGSITHREHDRIIKALGPLYDRFQKLSTVEQVRQDIRKAGSLQALQRQEDQEWVSGTNIPNFDLDRAVDLFFVTKKDDPKRNVVGINAEIDAQLAKIQYIPWYLNDGHLFFWIILRMCRLQNEIDLRREAIAKIDPLEAATDGFLRGEVPIDKAIAVAKEGLTTTASAKEELAEAARKAMEQIEHDPREVQDQLQPPSPVKRFFSAVAEALSSRARWRKRAIDTRLE